MIVLSPTFQAFSKYNRPFSSLQLTLFSGKGKSKTYLESMFCMAEFNDCKNVSHQKKSKDGLESFYEYTLRKF